jgi:long-chain acyl-CoA synthetase
LLLGRDKSNQNELEERKEKCYLKIWQPLSTPLERLERLKVKFLSRICFQCPGYSSNTFPAGKEKAELPPVCHFLNEPLYILYQYHGVSVYFGESIEK